MLMTTIITNKLSPVTLSQECATKSSAFKNKINLMHWSEFPVGWGLSQSVLQEPCQVFPTLVSILLFSLELKVGREDSYSLWISAVNEWQSQGYSSLSWFSGCGVPPHSCCLVRHCRESGSDRQSVCTALHPLKHTLLAPSDLKGLECRVMAIPAKQAICRRQ